MFSKGSSETPDEPLPPEKKAPPASSPSSGAGGVPSIISSDLRIVGNLHSSGDLQIDGAIEGDIASRSLTIGESAVVKGALSAEEVRIYGAVEGEVKANSVVLAKTAKVNGDIMHQTLSMEAGAELIGKLSRLQGAAIGVSASPPTARAGVTGSSDQGSAAVGRGVPAADVKPSTV